MEKEGVIIVEYKLKQKLKFYVTDDASHNVKIGGLKFWKGLTIPQKTLKLFTEEIWDHLKESPNDSVIIKELKRFMLSNWDKRFPTLLVHNAAALLDPSRKQLKSVSNCLSKQGETVVDFLLKTATELSIDISGKLIPVADMEITSVKQRLLEKHVGLRSTDDSFETEVSSYILGILSANEIEMKVLDWWKANQSKYPSMAILARGISAILAAAAPWERVWSASGLSIDEKQSSLFVAMFKYQLFLNCNFFSKNILMCYDCKTIFVIDLLSSRRRRRCRRSIFDVTPPPNYSNGAHL